MATVLRESRSPPHDNLPTSRANRQIEKRLAVDLNRVVNAIRRELPDYRISRREELHARIRPGLQSPTTAILRKHITDSYALGVTYITSLPMFRGISGYLTSSDLETIKSLATSYSSRFFGRVDTALSTFPHATITYASPSTTLSMLNPNYIVNALAIGATNEALNLATVQKARVLTGKQPSINVGVAQFEGEEDFLDLPMQLELTAQWRTSMDDRVCDICEGLEGEYSLSGMVPQPVQDSHPNCRCRILIEGA